MDVSYKDVLLDGKAALKKLNIESYALDAEVLLAEACGLTRVFFSLRKKLVPCRAAKGLSCSWLGF